MASSERGIGNGTHDGQEKVRKYCIHNQRENRCKLQYIAILKRERREHARKWCDERCRDHVQTPHKEVIRIPAEELNE